MNDLYSSLLKGAGWLVLLILIAYASSWVEFFHLPRSVKSPGTKNGGLLVKERAYFWSWLAGHRGLMDGYYQLAKRGLPFIIPSPGLTPDIMLPAEQQKWLVSHSDKVLSQRVANVESYALNLLFPSVDMHNEVMINVVKRYMSGRIGLVQGDMYEEMRGLVDTRLGTDRQWKSVRLSALVRDVVVRTGYRIHVGDDLAHNEEFVTSSWRMTLWAGIGTIIVGQFSPPLLKRPIGYLCSLPISYYIRKYRRLIYPVFKQRLDDIASLKAQPNSGYVPPQDAMTWTAQVLQEKNPEGATLESIIDNFITIFTAAFATIPVTLHALLNLIHLPEAAKFLPYIREEVSTTFSDPAAWTAPLTTAPSHMPLTEAFLRESMRYTPFFTRGQEHKVMAKEGVDLPDGTHVPQGVLLACPVAGVAADERFYEHPDRFDPFRFLREVEDEATGVKRWELRPNCQLTSPSDVFLGFGYGKHACPGRFFAARIMKLMVAYIVYHYEFEAIEAARPKNVVVGSFTVPPILTRARFRRKKT